MAPIKIVIIAAALAGLAGCASSSTAPPATAPDGGTVAAKAGPAAAPVETPAGRDIEGIKLSPEVIAIAKTEGKVELDKDKRVNCEKYKPLGSNRIQYRCQTVAEQDKSREDSARVMRKITTPPPSAESRH